MMLLIPTLLISCTLLTHICTVTNQMNATEELKYHDQQPVRVTYVHVNQKPYEFIDDEEWIFNFGYHRKSLHGIISRTMNYIIKKHCRKYELIPSLVPTYTNLSDLIRLGSIKELHDYGLEGEHFIFAPVPMSTDLYYKLHYYPELFSWQEGFAKSEGLVTVQRIKDVDLTKRIVRAVGKAKVLFAFIGILTLIAASVMWVIDRKYFLCYTFITTYFDIF